MFQGPQEAASVLEAFQVLLIGGELRGEEKTAVSCSLPDCPCWVNHTCPIACKVSILPVF